MVIRTEEVITKRDHNLAFFCSALYFPSPDFFKSILNLSPPIALLVNPFGERYAMLDKLFQAEAGYSAMKMKGDIAKKGCPKLLNTPVNDKLKLFK